MIIRNAENNDALKILDMQKLAYESEARRYNDFEIPPLHETVKALLADIRSNTVLVAERGDHIIGAVRGLLDGDTCRVGRLAVHPDAQGSGLGELLMRELEAQFPHAGRFELFTGHLSERNLHIYRKLGYVEFRRQVLHERLTFVFMEKLMGS
jgi:ribosomal protein S18 acetylase RimI-like enzyme